MLTTMCLAIAIYWEARGEPVMGQLAVGQVIMRRAADPRYPSSVCDVVHQGGERRHRCHFSFYCDGNSDQPKDATAWKRSWHVARLLVERANLYDFSAGATHYFNPSLADPDWGRDTPVLAQIGSHVFVRP